MRSRSRVAYISRLMPVPETSSTWVESQKRCEAMRCSSAMITRMTWARGGTSMPSIFSTARQ